MFKKCICLVVLVALLIFMAACSTVRYLPLDRINNLDGQQVGNLKVKTEFEEISFRHVLIRDGVIFGSDSAIPLSRVRKVEIIFPHYNEGAAQGFFIGMFGGYFLSRLITSGADSDNGLIVKEENVAEFNFLVTGLGAVIGATWGRIHGAPIKIILVAPRH